MMDPKPNQSGTENYFVKIIAGMLHDGGPVDLGKVLEANHGSGNGIADHILNCPVCQRKMKWKATH